MSAATIAYAARLLFHDALRSAASRSRLGADVDAVTLAIVTSSAPPAVRRAALDLATAWAALKSPAKRTY